jgi:3D (Asp-Asp-Asp) domain-containing protein
MIDGQIYEVQDRGGAITGNHFDVFCNTHQEALNFNMRTTSAYLVVE